MSSPPALPAWPDYALPSPSINDSLSQQYPDLINRTDFQQGPARQRTVFDSGVTTQWIEWPMSPEQAKIFHGFWRNEISSGADWFTINLFMDDDYYPFTVRFVGGQPTKLKRTGGEWLYAAVVETQDETAPDEYETAELLLTINTTETVDYVVQLFDTTVHQLPSTV